MGFGLIESSTKQIEIFDLVPDKASAQRPVVNNQSKTVNSRGSLRCLLDLSKYFSQSDSHFVGVVSSKTLSKAGISVEALTRFIVSRSKYSVYFVNAAAASEVFFENVWVRALFLQRQVARDLPHLLGAFNLNIDSARRFAIDESWMSFNNVVATPQFWKAIHSYLEKGLEKLFSDFEGRPLDVVLALQPQSEGSFNETAMFSIFADPLLTEFFAQYPDQFKTLRIRSARIESMLDKHCQKLMDLRKIVAETEREDLYQCWLGYRNLYLESKFGSQYQVNVSNIKNGIKPLFGI